MTKTEALTKHWDRRCLCTHRVAVHGDDGCTHAGCKCPRTAVQAASAHYTAKAQGHVFADMKLGLRSRGKSKRATSR